jgi:hypothetical protein
LRRDNHDLRCLVAETRDAVGALRAQQVQFQDTLSAAVSAAVSTATECAVAVTQAQVVLEVTADVRNGVESTVNQLRDSLECTIRDAVAQAAATAGQPTTATASQTQPEPCIIPVDGAMEAPEGDPVWLLDPDAGGDHDTGPLTVDAIRFNDAAICLRHADADVDSDVDSDVSLGTEYFY